MKKCLILANGKPPSKRVFDYLAVAGYDFIICADGGANSAFKLKLIPNAIIGDMDSVKPEVLKFYKNKCIIKKFTRQNDTDVEKCLKFAIQKKFDRAILLGGTGDRLDHSFCNLGIVLKFFDKIKLYVLHDKTLLMAHTGEVELNTIPRETISIYAINPKTKITSKGLKYPLKNDALPFGEKESTSNIALKDKVTLSIKNGRVFVIRDFQNLKKNGFFYNS